MRCLRFIFTSMCLILALQACQAEASQVQSTKTSKDSVVELSGVPLIVDANSGPISVDVISGNFDINYFVVDVWGAAHGTVSLTVDGVIIYEPDLDYVGQDGFDYTVSDDFGNIESDSVDIFVQPPSSLVFDNAQFIVENNSGETALDVLGSAIGDGFSVYQVSHAAFGNTRIDAVGTVYYSPPLDFIGVDTFTFEAADFYGTISTGTVFVTVVAGNSSTLLAEPDFISIPENANATEIYVLDNDSGYNLFVVDVSNALHGTTYLDVNGRVLYIPDINFAGIDTFSYTVQDGNGQIAAADVTVEVLSDVIVPPVIVSVYASASPTDILPGDSVSFNSVGDSRNGDVLDYQWDFGDGITDFGQYVSHTYTAPGTYVATVTVTDSINDQASDSVTICVGYPASTLTFTTSDFVGHVGTPLIFDVNGSTTNTAGKTFAWNFGDGSNGSDQVVSKMYSASGDYTVTLSVNDLQTNTTSSTQRTVHVLPSGHVPASKAAYKLKALLGKSAVGMINLNLAFPSAGVVVSSGTKVAFVFQGKRFDGTLNAKLSDATNPNVKWAVKSNAKMGMLTLTLKISNTDLGVGVKLLVNGSSAGSTVKNSIPIHIEIGDQVYEIAVASTFMLATDGKTFTGGGNGP